MNRGSFLAASASLVAAAGSSTLAAESVPGGTHFVERKADFDSAAFDAAVGKPADIRQVWHAIAFHPNVFSNVKNALNGLEFGFGHPPSRVAMVFAPHGPSTAYTYSDYIWSKYKIGEAFKLTDAKGNPVTSNVFLKPAKPPAKGSDPDAEDSVYQDTSIETLQGRGVVFLTCHTAVEEQARTLLKGGFAQSGMTPTEVANDLLTHLIPGTHVVPSMVATIAVLQQRYHYTYIAPAFA
jgi:intracellular sulfur oxidation DsrE/DsrF family protein